MIPLLGTLIVIAIACQWYTNQAIRQAEAYFPPQGKYVKVAGVRLHYVCQGSGQAVILLHGNPGFLQDYPPETIDRIAQKYSVYAFDLPGYGYSDRLDLVTPQVQAQLLRSALQKLGIDRPILVAYSASSAIALAYALRYPDEVAGIVLFSAIAYKVDQALLPFARFAQSSLLETLLKFIPPVLVESILFTYLKKSFLPKSANTHYLKAAKALWTRPIQLQASLEDSKNLQSSLDEMKKRYNEINVPVLIVVGDGDNFVSAKENSYRLRDRLSHSQLIIISNTGHAIPQSQPQEVVKAIYIIGQQI
ncbi:alpha/beta hydrolase [Hapalosiphon sp. MRB220]|nr:alpha/beta hydrolase [Hapalosiphon sp. MRB220]